MATAKKKASLLGDSSSSSEDEKPTIKVNPNFAKEYVAKKKAEELSRRTYFSSAS
jgi:hypothetical protein